MIASYFSLSISLSLHLHPHTQLGYHSEMLLLFLLGVSLPQLDGLVSGSTDNLTIISGEGNAQDIVTVIFKTPGGTTGR